MVEKRGIYRKNILLIAAFIVLISAILIVALLISYDLTRKYVENEFSSRKIEVMEKTMRAYNDFFQNKIPEITAYQGFLNKSSASKYAATVFDSYPFVKSINFYHFDISNHKQQNPNKAIDLNITVRDGFRFAGIGHITKLNSSIVESDNDFKVMASKLASFIKKADTSKVYTSDETFKTFYDIKPNKISYINNPRREELKMYKDLLRSPKLSSVYQQDMMTFYLSPFNLEIINTHRELYQHIRLRQVVYDPIDENTDENITTEIAFPGAFSDYKLYFQSSRSFVTTEVIRQFLPIAAVVVLIYFFVVVIGWLIYHNLNVNHKLFKLQYDFINNFTHEFKTPVSVIKIAGSNLRSEAELTDRQRMHYGKILDEEADKLNNLMNRLLSFTQLENKSIYLKNEEINLDEFVLKYINTFKIKYPDFDITYKLKNINIFKSDPVLLGSIFQNLIENAYKYSPTDCKVLYIMIERVKKDVFFLFADKGIGIPKNEMDNIFKKFYRIQSQYNQNGSVGLGLAFCKELVNFMNGEIAVKSKVNEGSEFKITLPY